MIIPQKDLWQPHPEGPYFFFAYFDVGVQCPLYMGIVREFL